MTGFFEMTSKQHDSRQHEYVRYIFRLSLSFGGQLWQNKIQDRQVWAETSRKLSFPCLTSDIYPFLSISLWGARGYFAENVAL